MQVYKSGLIKASYLRKARSYPEPTAGSLSAELKRSGSNHCFAVSLGQRDNSVPAVAYGSRHTLRVEKRHSAGWEQPVLTSEPKTSDWALPLGTPRTDQFYV